RNVQLASWAALDLAKSTPIKKTCGLNAGSSRGNTGKWEESLKKFYAGEPIPPQSSPHTTAGNLASSLAHFLQLEGIAFEHSITCSTFGHGLANAAAWLNSNMAEQFVVVGSEAPLTPFTFAQMDSLGVYSQASANEKLPCRALESNKKANSMVLAEAAIALCLEKNRGQSTFVISSIGFAKEISPSPSGMSKNGEVCAQAMSEALRGIDPQDVSAIVCHSPGTIQGDSSEMRALENVFGKNIPALTSNKYLMGHSFGASAGMSVEMGLWMLENRAFQAPEYLNQEPPKHMNRVLVNSIGFGGNAISILLERNPA
ncbi:MAG: beta-ketoacyl synthase N-terminal-like domain-containing protein, partial [Luteibaculum sp.]